MTLHTWWLFVMMSFVVSGTPGPNMLLVMSSSARHGMRQALATMAGCMTALIAMMCISAAGLGALLQAFPALFDALRWAGAAYLIYLGIKSWRAPVSAKLPQFAILVLSFAVIEGGWYLAYAAGGKRIAHYLRQASMLRLFNRVTGGAFVGFGALMAALRQA
jgi:threonine/homoserine/homoserine lactone efflux protein